MAERGPAFRVAHDPLMLRALAEASLAPGDKGRQAPGELEVYQAELDLQGEELRAAVQDLETLLARQTWRMEAAPAGLLALTPDGRVQEANRTALEILALGPEDLGERTLAWHVAEGDRARFSGFLAKRAEDGGEATLDVRLARADRWILLAGRSDTALLAVLDITERKRAEAAQEWRAREAAAGLQAAQAALVQMRVALGPEAAAVAGDLETIRRALAGALDLLSPRP